jgi:hypothetical protein
MAQAPARKQPILSGRQISRAFALVDRFSNLLAERAARRIFLIAGTFRKSHPRFRLSTP